MTLISVYCSWSVMIFLNEGKLNFQAHIGTLFIK